MFRTKYVWMFALLLCSAVSYAAVQGAIWTTNSSGTQVNGNIYAAKTDVYLSGGPQNTHSPGLRPDGVYYMMVTDPSGKVLLSTDDAVCREVTVSGGRITGVAPAAQTAGCAHMTSSANTATGGTPVQLMPFADTPNPGCEYKAWLILASAAKVGSDGKTLTFSRSNSKTDNFKVCANGEGTPSSTISGVKFYDANGNGVQDPGEATIPGYQIQLSGKASSNTTTDSNGAYSFLNLKAGSYSVCEVLPYASSQWFYTGETKWVATTKTKVGVTVPPDATVNFGNVCLGHAGAKSRFWWANAKLGGMIFNSADAQALSAMNLRDKEGAHVTFSNYADYAAWSNSATTTNWAYKLSVQLAALVLNVRHGFVQPTDLLYAQYAKTGTSGLISAQALIDEANGMLSDDVCGSTCFVPSGTSRTAYYFHIENHLDKADIDVSWVQPEACPVQYTGKEKLCNK